MAFRHRKLANDSAIDPIKFCEEHCDPIKYPDSICTGACLWCPPGCDNAPPAIVFTASPEPPHRISLLLTVSLSALAAVFFLFTCYTIYKFYSHWCSPRSRRRRSRQPDADPDEFLAQDPAVDHHVWYIRTVGLQPSVIGAITIVKYKKGDGLIEGSDCSVCLSEFQEDETLRLLPKCNHAFHVACIDTWLGSHTNCPMCRAGIINSQEEQIAQDSAPVEEGAASGGNRGAGRDSENESNEQRVGNEDQGGLLDGIQPLRRSISVDSLAVVGKTDNRSVGVKDCESGVVVARRSGLNQGLFQTGSTFSMKRSLSCSANVFLSKHSSRNRT